MVVAMVTGEEGWRWEEGRPGRWGSAGGEAAREEGDWGKEQALGEVGRPGRWVVGWSRRNDLGIRF